MLGNVKVLILRGNLLTRCAVLCCAVLCCAVLWFCQLGCAHSVSVSCSMHQLLRLACDHVWHVLCVV